MSDALDNHGLHIDPEMIDPEHMGKRKDHWIQLYTLWNDLIGYLKGLSYRSPWQEDVLDRLEVSTQLLGKMLTRDFDPTVYAREINRLGNNAEDIGDGKYDI